MKKINIKYLVLILLIALNACTEEYLERYPLDEISSEDYWKTTNDLKLYVTQFYPHAFDPFVGPEQSNWFRGDISSDDVTTSGLDLRLQGARTVPATAPGAVTTSRNVWQISYNYLGNWDFNTIRSVNYFLANYEKCEDPFDEYKQYVGEAYFFRAYYYYNKVKEFGDFPYIDKPLESNSEELYIPRTPRNQVIDKIIEDLNLAIEYMPAGKQSGGTRLNKDIALLFKSRVALYEGTWEKYQTGAFNVSNPDPNKYLQIAVDASQELIQSGRYSLYTTGNPELDYFFFAEVDYSNNPEVLLWKKYDLDLGMGHTRSEQMQVGDAGGLGLNKSFVESYLCTNGKPIYLSDGSQNPLYLGDSDLKTTSANRDPRFKQTIFTPGFPLQIDGTDTTFFERPVIDKASQEVCPTGYQLCKTLNWDPIHEGSGWIAFYGQILFRYSEALLNYAEAKAELGTLTQDDVDKTVNVLRDRVGMPHLDILNIETDPNWIFPDLSPVINEIRRERRIELVLEGFRWDDIARWAAADEVIVGKRPLGAKFNAIDYPDLSADDFRITADGYLDPLELQIPGGYGFDLGRDYLSPIATEELTLNPNLVQNPGW